MPWPQSCAVAVRMRLTTATFPLDRVWLFRHHPIDPKDFLRVLSIGYDQFFILHIINLQQFVTVDVINFREVKPLCIESSASTKIEVDNLVSDKD